MSQGRRILMTTSVFPRWEGDATPAFVQNLAQDLAAAGETVRILAPHSPGCPLDVMESGVSVRRHRYAWPQSLQTLCYEGGMLVRLRERRWRNLLLPLFALAHLRALKQEIETFAPDLVHAHSLLPQGWLAAKALSNRPGLPLVVSSHGNDVFGLQGRYTKLKEKTAKRATTLIANSESTRKALLEFCATEKTAIIPASPNQTDDGKSSAELRKKIGGDHKKLILFAGRLIPEKGIDFILKIFPEVLSRVPNAKLIICGDGPLKPEVESFVSKFSPQSSVAYLGWIPASQMSRHFAAVDAVAIPSQPQRSGWSEAQGLVAVEAMSTGTPVIASNIGGLAESITHNTSGFLVEPKNREDWVNTIVRVLSLSPFERNTIRHAAKARYQSTFSREAVLEKTLSVYSLATAEKTTP